MSYFAKNAQRLLKREKIKIGNYTYLGRSSYIVYKPFGVVAIISPWNYPWAIPLDEVVMALMAGNTVLLKPSEYTPLIGLKIGEIFERAGIPEGVLQVLTGDGTTGSALVDAGVDKILFTGSVATGKRIAERAASKLIPVVLELGGKDPLIVLEDADVRMAAAAAVWGAFSNSGQSCASVERCYVHEDVSEEFIRYVVEETSGLVQSEGSSEGCDIGAMSNERQLKTVSDHVTDAVRNGALVLAGGHRNEKLSGLFFEPTVVTNVNHNMALMTEETFGPVLPIMTFKTTEEAIRLANDTIFGLTASVWTRDTRKGYEVASKIEAGTIMVNEVLYTHAIAQTPWGGMKQSGLGRTHGLQGLMELVVPQHIHINRFTVLRDLWWYKYTPSAEKLFRGLGRNFAGVSIFRSVFLLPSILNRYRNKSHEKVDGSR
jgi:acyl-CoA reductase-like NAD-dependent aldehyde dehydrogenase